MPSILEVDLPPSPKPEIQAGDVVDYLNLQWTVEAVDPRGYYHLVMRGIGASVWAPAWEVKPFARTTR